MVNCRREIKIPCRPDFNLRVEGHNLVHILCGWMLGGPMHSNLPHLSAALMATRKLMPLLHR